MTKAPNAGRWGPGVSGNPAGRQPGTGEVAKLRAAIAKQVPAVVAKLVQEAKAGDVAAARLLLERVVPPLKASEEHVPLPLQHGPLTEQGQVVLAALAEGRLTPSQASGLLSSLGTFAQVVELEQLKARLDAIEGRGRGVAGSAR